MKRISEDESMNKLNVTLIITVLNEKVNMKEFLDSVLSMTMMPNEMIIVDGGSSDGTLEIIRDYTRKHSFIRLITEPGSNIARGRNIAIRHAAYSLIAMSDAGSRADARWLERIIAPFYGSSVDVVCGWTEIDARSKFERLVGYLHKPQQKIDASVFLPSARSVAMRKSCWESVGGFPENLTMWAEDTVFFTKLKADGYRFAYAFDAVVYWRPRKNLSEFFIQYFRYGVGDGEARLEMLLNLKRLVLILAPVLAGVGFILSPFLVILSVFILIYGFVYLMLPLKSNNVGYGQLVLLFGLVFIKDSAQVAGYVIGRIRRRKR